MDGDPASSQDAASFADRGDAGSTIIKIVIG
jgi:hypothetical protein